MYVWLPSDPRRVAGEGKDEMSYEVQFDPEQPNEKFVAQVLYQAFDGGSGRGPKDIYAEAWCLADMPVAEYRKLEAYLIAEGLIEESGEPGYFKITRKGEERNG